MSILARTRAGFERGLSDHRAAIGTMVVFESDEANLVSNDAIGGDELFVRDLVTGVTTLASVSQDGTNGCNNGTATVYRERCTKLRSCRERQVRGNSRVLDTNLVGNDDDGRNTTIQCDLQSGTTTVAVSAFDFNFAPQISLLTDYTPWYLTAAKVWFALTCRRCTSSLVSVDTLGDGYASCSR